MSLSIESPSKNGHWKGYGLILRYKHAPRAKTKAVISGITTNELKIILNNWDEHLEDRNGLMYNIVPNITEYKSYLRSCIIKGENITNYILFYLEIGGDWTKYVIYNKLTKKFILRSSCLKTIANKNDNKIGKLVESQDTNWFVNPTNIHCDHSWWYNLKHKFKNGIVNEV